MKQKELIQTVAAQVLKMLSDMLASVILIGKSHLYMVWYGLGRTNIVRRALKNFLDLIKSDECDKKSYVFIFVMFLVIFFEFLPPTIVPIATLRLVSF